MKFRLGKIIGVCGLAIMLAACGSTNGETTGGKQTQEVKDISTSNDSKNDKQKESNKAIQSSQLVGTWALVNFLESGVILPISSNYNSFFEERYGPFDGNEKKDFMKFEFKANGELIVNSSLNYVEETDNRTQELRYLITDDATEYHKLSDEGFSLSFAEEFSGDWSEEDELNSLQEFLMSFLDMVKEKKEYMSLESYEDEAEVLENMIKDVELLEKILNNDKEMAVYKFNFNNLNAIDIYSDSYKLDEAISPYKGNSKFEIINQTSNLVEYETTMRLLNDETVYAIEIDKNYLLLTMPIGSLDEYTSFALLERVQ